MASVTEAHMNGLDRELFEPDWIFTDEQIALREKLIEICEKKIRPRAPRTTRPSCSRGSRSKRSPRTASSACCCRRSGAASARTT